MNKTYMPKKGDIERKWYLVDATDLPLGRLASRVASVLRGKNKPMFTPNLDTGDYVIVINAEKVQLTGQKMDQKEHKYHTGYPGGLRKINYRDLLEKNPERAIEYAVKGMLPKNALGREMIKKLRVYKGEDHNHLAQKPEVLEF